MILILHPKTCLAQTKPNCLDVIKAADKALKEKDEAIKADNDALDLAKKDLAAQDALVDKKDKELSSVGRNGYVLVGAGVAGGALIAANVVLPGIGLVVGILLLTQVFHVF